MKRSSFITWDQLKVGSLILVSILVLGVATEIPVLFHALEPVRSPAAITFHMDHFECGQLLEDAKPDQSRHGRHRLERM